MKSCEGKFIKTITLGIIDDRQLSGPVAIHVAIKHRRLCGDCISDFGWGISQLCTAAVA